MWRTQGEHRGVWVVLAAGMNADPRDIPILGDRPSPSTLARRLSLFASALKMPWVITPQSTGFDLMISTVPEAFPVQQFMNLLKLDATLVNVGALEDLSGISGMANGFGRKSLAGSMIGGIAETQEVIDYCVARNISADVEIIRPDQINEAWDRVVGKDVRYRFVVDMGAA